MKLRSPLFNQFNDDFGGGDDFNVDTIDDDLSPGGSPDEGGEGDDVIDDDEPSDTTPAGGIDYNKLAETVARSVAGAVPQQQQQQPQTMTDEEFRKHTKYFAVTPEHVQQLFNADATPEQRVQMLQSMLDGAVQHALSVAALMTKRTEMQFQQRLTPIEQERQTQARNKYVDGIVKLAPQLKSSRQVIEAAMTHLAQSGYQSQGLKQDQIAILKTVQGMMRTINPDFKLQLSSRGGNRANLPKSAGAVNGAGGSGGGGNNKQVKSRGLAVFS